MTRAQWQMLPRVAADLCLREPRHQAEVGHLSPGLRFGSGRIEGVRRHNSLSCSRSIGLDLMKSIASIPSFALEYQKF